MNFPQEQVEELKQLFSAVEMAEEGGYVFFLIPNLRLPNGCTPETIDALLCPMPRDGYTSRLFFSQKIEKNPPPNPALNWNSTDQRILERNWYAYSWKINRSDLRLAQMVANHLKPLR